MSSTLSAPIDLAGLLRRYHGGTAKLTNAALERRFFGGASPAFEEPLGITLARVGVHKFDEDPARYDLLRAALHLLPDTGLTLLDVGSGSGRLALYWALLGAPRVHGIEILEPRVTLTRRAAAAHGLATVDIACGDALALEWPKAQALAVMNPFYPQDHTRLRARLIDYARAHDPLILTVSTLATKLAADDAFVAVGTARKDWIDFKTFRLR